MLVLYLVQSAGMSRSMHPCLVHADMAGWLSLDRVQQFQLQSSHLLAVRQTPLPCLQHKPA